MTLPAFASCLLRFHLIRCTTTALQLLTNCVFFQQRLTRQAGQIKSAIAMRRPDKIQWMSKRLTGADSGGTSQQASRAQALELVRGTASASPTTTS
jgi:hypothetical protein